MPGQRRPRRRVRLFARVHDEPQRHDLPQRLPVEVRIAMAAAGSLLERLVEDVVTPSSTAGSVLDGHAGGPNLSSRARGTYA